MIAIRRCWWVVGGAMLLLCVAARADTQRGGLDIYEEELRVRLDEQIPDARDFGFDYGAWLTFGNQTQRP